MEGRSERVASLKEARLVAWQQLLPADIADLSPEQVAAAAEAASSDPSILEMDREIRRAVLEDLVRE